MHIDAPPEKVWALVSDVTRIGEFSPETFEAEWLRGATGPGSAPRSGSREAQRRRPTYWSACGVTKCEPKKAFEFEVGTKDITVNDWGYRLRGRRTRGTTVTEYFRLEPRAAAAALLAAARRGCAVAPTSAACAPRSSG